MAAFVRPEISSTTHVALKWTEQLNSKTFRKCLLTTLLSGESAHQIDIIIIEIFPDIGIVRHIITMIKNIIEDVLIRDLSHYMRLVIQNIEDISDSTAVFVP